VYGLVALNRPAGGVEFPEALLGIGPAFDRTMILFQDVIQVLDGAMETAAP
jgi:hypothetical protein